MNTVYGIKNCDTMKKALKWLETQQIDFLLHDYKKDGVPSDILAQAIKEHGWEDVINRRGTTWRKLSDNVRDAMDEEGAMKVALENPSIIKRPLLCHKNKSYLGFKVETYQRIFS